MPFFSKFVSFLNIGNQLYEFFLHLKESVDFNYCKFRLQPFFRVLHNNKLVNVKVNFTPEQARKAQGVVEV